MDVNDPSTHTVISGQDEGTGKGGEGGYFSDFNDPHRVISGRVGWGWGLLSLGILRAANSTGLSRDGGAGGRGGVRKRDRKKQMREVCVGGGGGRETDK